MSSLIYSYFVVPSTTYALLFFSLDTVWRFIISVYDFKKQFNLIKADIRKDFLKQLKLKFNYNKKTIYSIVVLAMFVTYVVPSTQCIDVLRSHNNLTNALNLLFVYFLSRSCDWNYSIYYEYCMLKNNHSLDYGSGMAYSYFYGYLKILLPHRGDETQGIKERIAKYESRENVYFPIKKLFILIPDSLYLPPNLAEENKLLFTANSLEEVVRCRGGVTKRIYKNSVYKLENELGDIWYVCAEGATPLLTYYESIKESRLRTQKELTSLIVEQFYETLKYLVSDYADCCDEAELIYYKALDKYDKPIDVGVILRNRIKELL